MDKFYFNGQNSFGRFVNKINFCSCTSSIIIRLEDQSGLLKSFDNRSISNFIENAALRFIEEEEYIDDFENDEILSNKELMDSIQRGCEESIEGKGKLVEL